MTKFRMGLKSRLLKLLVMCLFMISSVFPALTANAAMNASASSISDTQIQLQWSWPLGAVTCSIYRNGATAPLKTVNINSDSEYTSFTDSGLTPETQYNYKLELKNNANIVMDSAEVNAETLAITRPVIISAVFNVNNEAEKEHTITIKWKNASASAKGAVIKRADGTQVASINNVSEYMSGDTVTYSFKDTVAEYGQALQYTVTTTDSEGRISQPSLPVSVIPVEPPELSAVMTDGTALISWPEAAGIENFQLERSKYDGSSWGSWESVNATIPAGAANVSDTPTAAGTYRYRLTALATGKYAGSGNISEPVLKLTAPTGLVCTLIDTDKLSLTWVNDANNKGIIKVEKRTGTGSFTEIATLARNINTYTDTDDFTSGETYYYRVVAYDTDNNKAASDASTISLSEPSAPAGLEVTIVSSRNLRLTWEDKSDNETAFKIERRTASGDYSEIGSTGTNVNQYSDSGVTPDNTYTYRVCATNSFGTSAYGNEVTVTALTAAAPESLNVKAVSSTQIDISWNYYDSNPPKTIIERKLPEDKTWNRIAEVVPDIKSYSDTNLKENTLYAYRIRALVSTNVYSEYFPSSTQSYGAYTKLGKPEGLTATVTPESAITLAWNDNSSETGFVIERVATSTSSSYYVVGSTKANVKSWTDNDITPGKTYKYRVQARTDKNESDYSTEIIVTATRILAPTSLTVGEGDDGKVGLTWQDNSDNESGFEIWRMTGSAGTWEKIATVGQNITSYTDDKIKSDTQYYYKVRAYISSNSAVSDYTNEVNIVVQMLQAPGNTKAAEVSDTQIRLTWDGNLAGAAGISIERKKAGGTYEEVDRIDDADQTMYLDHDLVQNTKYYYRIRAYAGNKFSEYSGEVYATTKAKVEFKDLGSVSWARTAIENMAARGVINGTGNGNYTPMGTMTRAEFVCILVRAFNLGDYTASSSFADVKQGKWYYKELMAAKALGIISADDDDNFYPEKPITREDIAVIIGSTLGVVNKQLEKVDTAVLDDFTDSESISDYALQSVANVYKAEIMVGNGNGTLTPKATATRAQAAVIIYRVIDR